MRLSFTSSEFNFIQPTHCQEYLLPRSSYPLLLLPSSYACARELRDFHIHVQLNWAHRRTGRGKEMGKQDCKSEQSRGRQIAEGRRQVYEGAGAGPRAEELSSRPSRPEPVPYRPGNWRGEREENSAASIRGGRRRAVAKQL